MEKQAKRLGRAVFVRFEQAEAAAIQELARTEERTLSYIVRRFVRAGLSQHQAQRHTERVAQALVDRVKASRR